MTSGSSFVVIQSFNPSESRLVLRVGPGTPRLRAFGEAFWAGVVEAAGARILSGISGERCDAYVLSESSLFVFDDRWIIVTCGGSDLPKALFGFLAAVPASCVESGRYERRPELIENSKRAEESFKKAVRAIHRKLPGVSMELGSSGDRCVRTFVAGESSSTPTLGLLMYDLDEEVCRRFTKPHSMSAHPDVHFLLGGYTTDDHVFDPRGYSINAIDGDRYWTVHVTPEQNGSYASFETDHVFTNLAEQRACLERVLEVFQPRSADLIEIESEWTVDLESLGYSTRAVWAESGALLSTGTRMFSRAGPRARYRDRYVIA